jgi:hypothetical protein
LRASCVIAAGVIAAVVLGCQRDKAEPVAGCDGADASTTYRTKGTALVGDVDADGAGDRVTLRLDAKRPARCRHLLVVQLDGGTTAVATVPPLGWPGGNPQLLLLAEIDGRPGLEPVVTLSPANAYRPGVVYTLSRGELLRMRLEKVPAPDHFPLYDEFPAGVDCAGPPGTIVVTHSRIADGGDRFWDTTRSFYRATSRAWFAFVRAERFLVDVGDEAPRRWPEVLGDPFLRCAGRVR